MFVSRLHPHSTLAEVEECAKNIVGDNFEIVELHCNKLKARHEHLYSSVYLQLRVNSVDTKEALDIVMCNESGLFYCRKSLL